MNNGKELMILTGRGPVNRATDIREAIDRPLWYLLKEALKRLDYGNYDTGYQIDRKQYDRYIQARQVLIAAMNAASADLKKESVNIGKYAFFINNNGSLAHNFIKPEKLVFGYAL